MSLHKSLQLLEPEIWEVWQEGNYYRVATMLSVVAAQHPEELTYRHYLGLAYLLQGRDELAQSTWRELLVSPQEMSNLVSLLQLEAAQQEQQQAWRYSERIRKFLQEIAPGDINNLLRLVLLKLRLEELTEQDFAALELAEKLRTDQTNQADQTTVDLSLLLVAVRELLTAYPEWVPIAAVINAALPFITDPQPWLAILQPRIQELVGLQLPGLACNYAEFCLVLDGENLALIRQSARLFAAKGFFEDAIPLAKKLAQTSNNLFDQMLSNVTLLHSSLRMGASWAQITQLMQKQLDMLNVLLAQTPEQHDPIQLLEIGVLANSLFLQPYFGDRPTEHHALRYRMGQFLIASFQESLAQTSALLQPTDHKSSNKGQNLSIESRKLRIGYIGQYLRKHSVGWISRWLFAHHDHDQFEIYTYFNQHIKLQEFSERCFAKQSDVWRTVNGNVVDIAHTIQADEIDILVDVDSLTSNETYGVMALKPAPIQVTWLGWDAPGLSTVDYFIADPYVLPDDAQDYYAEKIWRLPQTYVAVQGFEVDFPTRRRADLDIPEDAIVYFSNQTALKRHPEFVRVQMQVLRKVPHSVFLIKNWGDLEAMQAFFGDIAETEGVSRDRLRFLSLAPTEPLYRANLMNLADVVLDSYPYSGATTTLETLWVGLPLVTRVGSQFAARNSYTMMVNAGITEGIAWSDEEYIDWAVRLGTSEELRQQVFTKLMRSRQTAPLWNAQQFTRDMETAYQQMWNIYCEAGQQ